MRCLIHDDALGVWYHSTEEQDAYRKAHASELFAALEERVMSEILETKTNPQAKDSPKVEELRAMRIATLRAKIFGEVLEDEEEVHVQ